MHHTSQRLLGLLFSNSSQTKQNVLDQNHLFHPPCVLRDSTREISNYSERIMSTSCNSSRRSRRYCQRTSRSIPSEIDLYASVDLDEEDQEGTNDWTLTPSSRIQLVPGHTHNPPEEPQDLPPTPTEIVRIVVVGDASAGKTSMVRSFVYREGRSYLKTNTSKTFLLEYHKKDMAFWKNSSDEIGCARLQIWDVSDYSDRQQPELETLLQKAHLVMCVVSVEHGQSHLIESIQYWKIRLAQYSHVRMLLHKSDLLSPSWGVQATDWILLGSRFTTLLNGSDFYITSCVTDHGTSVQNAIMKEVRKIVTTKSNPGKTEIKSSSKQKTIRATPLIEVKAVPIYSLHRLHE